MGTGAQVQYKVATAGAGGCGQAQAAQGGMALMDLPGRGWEGVGPEWAAPPRALVTPRFLARPDPPTAKIVDPYPDPLSPESPALL